MRVPLPVFGGLVAASLLSAGLAPVQHASAATHRQSDDARYVNCTTAGETTPADQPAGTGTYDDPWQAIDKIDWNAIPPTGQLLFAKGTTCHGTLEVIHSGTYERPFTISDYTPPSASILPPDFRAVIDGRYKAHDNTDLTFAKDVITIHNREHVKISNLEIRNDHGSVTARRAISITTDENEPLSDFEIDSVFIHDFGNIDTEHEEYDRPAEAGPGGAAAAIKVEVEGTDNKNAKLNDVYIHDSKIEDVGFDGIITWSEAAEQDADPSYETAFTGLRIEKNDFYQIRGGAVAVGNARNAIVRENVVRGFITQGHSSAAMYPYYSIGTKFQLNTITDGGEVEDGRGDGQAFDLDQGAKYTVFERNFTNNNREGFMLMCVGSGAAGSTDYTVVRYNISVDDGKYGFKFSTCPEVVNHLDIYNNTFVIGKGISQTVFEGQRQDMWGNSIRYRNNIVTAADGGQAYFDLPYRHNIRFDHNVFHGLIDINDEDHWDKIPPNDQGDDPSPEANPGGTTADPMLSDPADPDPGVGIREVVEGYRLLPDSPALGAGQPLDHAPTCDAFRRHENTITPNIGADNAVGDDECL